MAILNVLGEERLHEGLLDNPEFLDVPNLLVYLLSSDPSLAHQFIVSIPGIVTPQLFLFALFKLFFLYPACWDSISDILSDWAKSRKEDFDISLVQHFQTIMRMVHSVDIFDPFYKIVFPILTTFTKQGVKYRLKKLEEIDLPSIPISQWAIDKISPKEVAKHITLYYHRLIVPLISSEISKMFWQSGVECPNFTAYQDYFSQLSYQVSFSILVKENLKLAAAVHRFWSDVAQQLHELHNYTGASSVMNGLLHESVKRLVRITKLSINKEKERNLNFQNLSKFYSSIPGMVKESLKFNEANPNIPVIPSLILIKSEISNVIENSKKQGQKINLLKFPRVCQFIEPYRPFLNQKYHYKEHLKISEFVQEISLSEKIRNFQFLMKLSAAHDQKKK